MQIWDAEKLTPLYIINPFMDTDSGDIYCLCYSPTLHTVYFGCQNTSLQWFDLDEVNSRASSCSIGPEDVSEALMKQDSSSRPGSKRNKFFSDGVASGQATPTPLCQKGVPRPRGVYTVTASEVIDSAHFGYVYSMAILPSTLESNVEKLDKEMEHVLLVTGSGDETVKVRMRYYPTLKAVLI